MKSKRYLIILCFFLLVFPCTTNAQTINDIRNKIKEIEAEKAENEKNSEDVQNRINAANDKIKEITAKIVEAREDEIATKKEISKLDKQISVKEEEIKDLIAFYQISDNDNFYLKFIFGADSFEDFIYRFSVAEQLTEANDNLVKEMNDLVEKNEKKMKELEVQQQKLDSYEKEINVQIQQLGSQKRKYSENALSADEEIATLNKQIEVYKKKGCGEYDVISVCTKPKVVYKPYTTNRKPSAKGFILPLSYGEITSYYGGRIHPIFGVPSYHDGVDIAASTGTNVAASNSGVVVYAGWYGGFGNAVMIDHSSVGYDYTTLYGHMSSIGVSTGDYVSRGQKVGEVGSTGNSTGPHLHFQAMYGSGYGSSFDPEDLVSIPLRW